jgi:hypothetical protein
VIRMEYQIANGNLIIIFFASIEINIKLNALTGSVKKVAIRHFRIVSCWLCSAPKIS